MTNFNLSICMPSNRNHNGSRASISSALNFCDLTNSELIVSDNSYDIKKSNFWNNLNLNFLKYEKDAPLEGNSNWHNALNKSHGLYAGILSDDDLILNIDKPAVDYKEIFNNNILGIKPIIQLWNETAGTYQINNFNISDDTAKLRLVKYLTSAKGNNTTLYSFFNKPVFLDLLSLSLFHPTKGGYTDWAFVAGLVSSGKILVDSSKLLIYKNTNWFGTQDYINEQEKKLYIKAGLDQRCYLFRRLFTAIDSFIYVLRKTSPITREEAIEASTYVFELNLEVFINEVNANKNNFKEYEKSLVNKISCSNHIREKLEITLQIIDNLNSEMRKKYLMFYNKAIGCDWGDIK